MIWVTALSTLIAYLIGSISGSMIVSRGIFKEDIRTKGSGNAGTTNTYRAYGLKYAVISLSIDIFKAVISTLLVRYLVKTIDPTNNYAEYFAGVAVVVGHIWPIYYKFKGGKGMATSFGLNIMYAPVLVLVQIIEFVGINFLLKIMSLTSIIMTLTAILYAVFFADNINLSIMIIVNALIVLYSHRSNVKRLIDGTENKIERLEK